ncbi:tetratricopeptide repeat protein [Aquimarina algiphila]|uniref:tetratricopeptide repeat protein n=1 Tax=Aquimarina algiphila TaxID=2047982 RepID=UPI0024911836|nr:tetratricopeptide repeat protein [Aquimarina algiphila]
MQLRFYNITLLLLLSFVGFGQSYKVPDSLKGKSYRYLEKSFESDYEDTLKCRIYLNTILNKSIKENNLKRQARAYCLLSYYVVDDSEKIALIDKAIQKATSSKDYSYLLLPYSFKGVYFHYKADYKSALNNYLKVLKIAKEVNSSNYIDIAKHNIGLIKTDLGRHKEALSILKESFLHEKNRKEVDTFAYLESLLSLADSYRYNKLLDSATFYNTEGIIKSKIIYNRKNIYETLYPSFVFNEGVNLFFKGNFLDSRDSIQKGLSLTNFHDPSNLNRLILGNFYSGNIEISLGNYNGAFKYFLKLDSIVQQKQVFIPEVRYGYEYLIKIYKKKKDRNKQLEFINKLLLFDSITNKQRNFVTDKLFTEFDTPKLIAEKEKLIAALEKENTKILSQNLIISILLAISLFGGGYY